MIGGIVPCSFIDYPGELAAVVFTRGCNMRCRYCHNPALIARGETPAISLKDLERFLHARRGKLTAVVVSGGEPTLHADLNALLHVFRSFGLSIKLDTNGLNYQQIAALIAAELVDYIAVDFKVPRCVAAASSKQWLGVAHSAEKALQTLAHVAACGIPHEARTTVVQGVHDCAGLEQMAGDLFLAKVEKWRLQPVDGRTLPDRQGTLSPPGNDILMGAVCLARSLGIDAAIRPVRPAA